MADKNPALIKLHFLSILSTIKYGTNITNKTHKNLPIAGNQIEGIKRTDIKATTTAITLAILVSSGNAFLTPFENKANSKTNNPNFIIAEFKSSTLPKINEIKNVKVSAKAINNLLI